ncbi:MATE family efflux transporter [Epibacterium ulvae]|uniref:MATE family efflux transporter n=1 Tax=Epibacterium ulvae TaxID=1156985 RepID=UPI001BFC4679|nr:MATE family efflux transporter [Epibacterium ulvae]MBT8152881.1 MATE family efflux transporter [Epibacterium ulvae]
MTVPTATQPVTHRRVLKIALPVVLSNATVPLLGVVDTGVVGQLGEAASLGAVAVGSIILTSLYWMFGFLRMGTVGLASQEIGRSDHDEVTAILTRCLLIGLGAGAAFVLLQAPLFSFALHLAGPSSEASELARSYLGIRIWSAPAMIAIYGLSGWLIAQERTYAFFAIQVVMNLLNMVLDIWFVLGLGWGVDGVAYATFIAEWSGFAVGLWLCRDAFASPRWRNWGRVMDPLRLKHMAMVNSDILIRSLLLQAVFTSFTFLAARQGDVMLAANQILIQLMFVTAYGMDGFAFAAETLVGQALGAQKRQELRRSARITSFWGMIVVALMALSFALWGGVFINWMTTAPDVREAARVFLPYIVAAPILGWASWMLDGIFIGATASRDMRNMMILSTGVYVIAVLALLPTQGNHGLWIALLISFVARGITLGMRYPALEARAGA